jgi:hypothetical protein
MLFGIKKIPVFFPFELVACLQKKKNSGIIHQKKKKKKKKKNTEPRVKKNYK